MSRPGEVDAVDLSGVLIPVVTPFDAQGGAVDLAALGRHLRFLLRHPIRGVVVAGSTGEAVLLDEGELDALVESAARILPSGPLLIVGTGRESTRATLRACARAAEGGADAVLVQPPAFYRRAMTPAALREHYRAVAAGSPLPVIVYQVPPSNSTLDLPAGLVAELSRSANVVGMKDSRGRLDLFGDLAEAVPASFQLLVGSGAHLYAALEIGAVGGILAVANFAPRETAAIFEAFVEGRVAEAGRLQERVGALHRAVVGSFGAPGVKMALDLLGRRGGPPRPPLRGLRSKSRTQVRTALAEAGLLDTRDSDF